MKIGKGPKRFGGPSPEFLVRKAKQDKARRETEQSRVPAQGDINLFLDDEREAPKGWVLLRTPYAFLEKSEDKAIGARVRRIALDWYLGPGQPNGDAVAKDLAAKLMDPEFMPNLEMIHFHSSVHENALNMLRVVQAELGDRDIILDLGSPWDNA